MSALTRAPQRIRRARTKGWRLPEGAVIVTRPTRWGNPFRIGDPINEDYFAGLRIEGRPAYRDGIVEDAAHAVTLFELNLMLSVPYTQADLQAHLAGRDLACYCALDAPCHADVLLRLANETRHD